MPRGATYELDAPRQCLSVVKTLVDAQVLATPLGRKNYNGKIPTNTLFSGVFERLWHDDVWCHVKITKIASPYEVICWPDHYVAALCRVFLNGLSIVKERQKLTNNRRFHTKIHDHHVSLTVSKAVKIASIPADLISHNARRFGFLRCKPEHLRRLLRPVCK